MPGRPAPPALALFGGSFNPPHVGHLAVAEAAAEAAGLDRVVWMPAALNPHKRAAADVAPAEHRLEMARLATAGNARFEVSDLEARRGGISYTVDTVRRLQVGHPETDVVLLLGGDSLAGFHTWHEADELLGRVRLIVYRRPGADERDVPARVLARTTFVEAPPLDLSASLIRERLRAGRTVRYLVPDAVRVYAERHGLYR